LLTVPEVRRLVWHLVWERRAGAEEIVRWSWWRSRHQARAKRGHHQRRLARGQP